MYVHVLYYVYCISVCAAGLYVQGIYRKSPGASSKRAVKATLEDGIVTHKHTLYSHQNNLRLDQDI